jgi:hypothetical protein
MRPRDGILANHGVDIDAIVHPFLTRLSGAFLDQGIAYWPMPEREGGFLRAADAALREPHCVLPQSLELLPVILRWHDRGLDAEDRAKPFALDAGLDWAVCGATCWPCRAGRFDPIWKKNQISLPHPAPVLMGFSPSA